MKILRVHNRYQFRGGEDAVFEAECALVERHGHTVQRMEFSNTSIPDKQSALEAFRFALSTIWSPSARRRIREAIDAFQPDVAHYDNTFPLISPSAYGAAKECGVAVVQTLHNYRLLCPSATLSLNGLIYEDNVGKLVPWRAVRDRAYRGSASQTAVVAGMLTIHRLLGTYYHNVDCYIALTEFQRQKFIGAGFDPGRVVVKPNFSYQSPEMISPRRSGFLFVGRLTAEKGIHTLLSAFNRTGESLLIAGAGPMEASVMSASQETGSIKRLGEVCADDVRLRMAAATAVVLPSVWYEGFPMTLVESFSTGTPVIVARLGSLAEIVEDGVTGLHFEAGNADDLESKVAWAAAHPEEMRRMGENALREYEAKYTPERNYQMLMSIYEQAIAHSQASKR